MLNCRDATKIMSEARERRLSILERMSLKFHLSMCKGCSNFNQHMGVLKTMTNEYAKKKDE